MSSIFPAALSTALIAAIATGAVAQPVEPSRSAASAVPPPSESSPGYRSAFDGYRPFAEQPLKPWRQSNDLVGRIGGWQAYAREGQGGPPEGGASAAQGAGSMPAMSGMKAMSEMPDMQRHGASARTDMQSNSPRVVAPPANGASGARAGHKVP